MEDLTVTQAMAYEIIKAAAEKGDLCPADKDLAEELGVAGSTSHSILIALERKGLIRQVARERRSGSHGRHRQIEICATWHLTAPVNDDMSEDSLTYAGRAPVPCFKCGCRADVCQCRSPL